VISVDDYRAELLAGIEPLTPIELPIPSALGCVLAEAVEARWPLPPFDNSSMDGYAVRSADLATASAEHPVRLDVLADVPAGEQPVGVVRPMTAARIMTGAPMPEGADAVVPVERTDAGIDAVSIFTAPKTGDCIRRAGEDVLPGEEVMQPGVVLTARQIALLAAVGRSSVLAHPQPRVLVVSTGSELAEPGAALSGAQIPDSNGPMLCAAVQETGAVPFRAGPVPDDEAALIETLEDRLHVTDLILTSGGVSMGAYDTVKAVLSARGAATFTKVAMQPGMPQGHGSLGHEGERPVPVITLPGNPVSAYVSFAVFVLPVIRRMQGRPDDGLRRRRALSAAEFRSSSGKRQYLRGRWTGASTVEPVGGTGSHLLGGLSRAECLIVVPEDVTSVVRGQEVEVLELWR
jgi:molybdopterin molybdotransferase